MFKFKFNPFKRKKPARGDANKLFCANYPPTEKLVESQLEIKIGDILVRIIRSQDIPPTNELTAVIPRAEIRRRRYENGRLVGAEEEIILTSITLVDSARKTEGLTGQPAPPLPTPSGTPAPPR